MGVLTGGGDCPGLNAVIRAIVRASVNGEGHEILGLVDGWDGLLKRATQPLTLNSTRGILHRGGTILGSSRTNARWFQAPPTDLADSAEELGLDALIAIGGDGTLQIAQALHQLGVPVVGVPKTIDNDLGATDMTFGFDTAVQVATDAIDRLHTTAESHRRVFVVELMGRQTGWIALNAGLAGGADALLVPERNMTISALCDRIHARTEMGRRSSVVVIAEGVRVLGDRIGPPLDPHPGARHGGVAYELAAELEARTGVETRALVLGHLQRGGTPTAYDRLLATRFGIAALHAVDHHNWGQMPALKGTRIELVPLADAIASLRTLSDDSLADADAILGKDTEALPL